MPLLTQPVLARAGRLFLAAMIALAVAGMLGIHHLYWAVIPVWVVFQPYREEIALRAILRVVGTLVGAGAGLVALQELPVPGIALAVAAITAIGVGFAYRIGTAWSYGFTLMALSIGVVVMPALGDGANGIALAQDRVIATLIGVLAVTAVKWFFTPARAAPMPSRPCPHFPVQMCLRMAATALMTGAVTFLVAHFGDPASISAGVSVVAFSSLLASMPNPRPVIRSMVPGVAIGVLAALAYHLVVATGALGPAAQIGLGVAFIAAGSLVRAHPRTALPGIDMNICFLLASGLGTAPPPLAIAVASSAAIFASAAFVAGLLHVLSQLHGPTDRERAAGLDQDAGRL